MTDPASTAAAVTLVAASATVPVLTAFGVPLGLRPDYLVAGFSGAVVGLTLLNSVPSIGDTWRNLLDTTLRRMLFSVASSLTAGYLTPLMLLLANVPDALVLGAAFSVGAGAQQALIFARQRLFGVSGGAS
jgi:hypothetical protein